MKNPGCISRKKVALKTRDGVEVQTGQRLYFWEEGAEVLEFRASAWNDGRTADLHFRKRKKPAYFNIEGTGGSGVYPRGEWNIYARFPVKNVWKNLDKLIEFRRKHYMKLANHKPKVVRTNKIVRTNKVVRTN